MSESVTNIQRQRFAENVLRARKAADLTQEKAGWACGLHPTEIARIERGQRNPGLDTIVKLAKGLNVTASDLMRGLPLDDTP